MPDYSHALAPPTNIVFINTTIIGHHKKLRLRKFGLNGSVLQLPLMFPLRTR
jgi:hypothetical protein